MPEEPIIRFRRSVTKNSNSPLKSFPEGSIFEKTIQFFEEEEIAWKEIEEKAIVGTFFEGENGEWNCYAIIREEAGQLLFYSRLNFHSPENRRLALAEFITQANYGIFIGNFELDFTDGEINYKTSIDAEGSQLDMALVKRLFYTNVLMMDRYLPGIQAVIEATLSPTEAIAAIEG